MSTVKLRLRDLIALLLLAAVVVPYAGYLLVGEMPMIDDPRGMASTGLFFGGAAFLVIRGGHRGTRIRRAELGAAVLAVLLYVLTIGLGATAAAELLLAGFMFSVLLVFALDFLDHGQPHDAAPHR